LVLTSIHRKEWIEHRLQELAQVFAVAVGGFSVLDNHLHLLVRLDPEVAKGWSDEEVVRRWGQLFPPRDNSRQPLPVSNDWIQWRLKDAGWVATARERMQSLSWFMKCLKEPLSRLADGKIRRAARSSRDGSRAWRFSMSYSACPCDRSVPAPPKTRHLQLQRQPRSIPAGAKCATSLF